VHDALLESSLSKPQDDCSTDVPESSKNCNPTATSTNPSGDQMETLTVETPIPTVSSPVPTACFTDSQEPSSDARLISKRVANQVETPSLDNILTLTNRFEDILGVTTNSVNTDGVEADVSNMETTCTSSPTPTLRIHKDHPKSQIIGPVDTPIQTKNKSKEIFDALQDPSWVEAMQEELLQFKIQNVWTLVDCPKGIRPIGTKWVLKNRKDERGIVIRNKARLVAQGHTQEEGTDYDEVFAPVARIEAIRLFLACASFMGFTVYQMDVKIAFLYGTIDKEVYVMQPPRFQDSEFPVKVYKVEKAMYGLNQDPRAWYGTLSKYLLINGFQRGELNFFLSLQVLQKEDGIFLTQDKYVVDILKKFGYSDVRSSNTLMDKENPWGKDGTGKDVDLHLYRSMVGSLMYLTASRPDIMFAVCACAWHQVTPKECHLHVVKMIFRYLKGHPILGLWYPKESSFDLVAYSDSDYGGATQDHKSTTRGCQFLGRISLNKPFDVGRFQYLVVSIGMDEHSMLSSVKGNLIIYTSFFWSTARIEIPEEGTKILATVDGILRTVTESSLRRNLKLKDEEGISSLPDAELFENLTLMGYNISPNQKFTFQKGQFSHQWKQYTRRARIAQSSALPPVADEPASPLRDVSEAPRVTSPAADEGSKQQTLDELTAFCTSLQRQHSELVSKFEAQELEINMLKARVKLLEDREGGEEMATVLTFMDAATILASGVVKVPTGSGSIPTAAEIPTGSDVVLAACLIFTTTTVVTTPYIRRKGKETMVESETSKKKKQKRDYYMEVIKSNLGWKVKDFKGMTFEEIEAKFITVWKQLEDFIPIGSKEEAERFKRKGIRFEKENVKKLKILEEAPEEVKTPDEVPEEKVKEMMQLVPIKEHMDREDLNQFWALVKESLSIRQPTSDKEMELWVELKRLYEPDDEDQLWTHTHNLMHALVEWKLYDMCGVHQVTSKDKEIFMLVEKDYHLRKGLAIVMIWYKLQVENYS
nr:hypothetical protein [Tanacetum cinerariifolium]